MSSGELFQIPPKLKTKIINIHGIKGKQWIEKFPSILAGCIKKWNLANVSAHTNLSFNVISFAFSPEYGEVVLKLGVPAPGMVAEAKALKFFGSNVSCKCYDYDTGAGAFLLERIIPGNDLTSVGDFRERINIVSALINETAISAEEGAGLPYYSRWISQAFKKARDENHSNSKLIGMIDKAEGISVRTEKLNLPLYVLHGDLHHTNILFDGSGKWKVIDAQGVIGIRALSPAVFLENQIRMTERGKRFALLEEMLSMFSQSLREPVELITACLFIDSVLSICWDIEDGASFDDLLDNVEDCELFYSFV